MLQKGVYPNEYMEHFGKINQRSLPEKEDFYSHINIEDITDSDYGHAKKVCKAFETQNLGEYLDLYVQINYFYLMYLKTLEIFVWN